MAVYKYTLPMRDVSTIRMPRGAKVLSVQVQHGEVRVWALVDPSEDEHVDRIFRVAGTGHSIGEADAACPFVGTVQLHGGALVFHIFDIGES